MLLLLLFGLVPCVGLVAWGNWGMPVVIVLKDIIWKCYCGICCIRPVVYFLVGNGGFYCVL